MSPYHRSDVLIRNNDSSGKELMGLVSSTVWGISHIIPTKTNEPLDLEFSNPRSNY